MSLKSLSLVLISLIAVGCETVPVSNSSSTTVTPVKSNKVQAKSVQPAKKHVPHALEVREVLRKDPTMKEFSEYRDQWRDWPEDTGKFKTTTKYRFPGGEFLIWWKPDKHTPEAAMAAYRFTKYRE